MIKIFCLLLLVSSALAKSYEERALVLIEATNITDLNNRLKIMDAKEDLKRSCQWELSNHLIPRRCYLLSLKDEQTQIIDEACRRAAAGLEKEVSLDHLSSKCRNYVSQKNMDLRYRFKEVDPAGYILKR